MYQTFLIAELEYVVATCLIKLTFCWTLLYIVNKRVNTFLTHSICVVMFVDLVQALFYFFYVLFSCKPIPYLWTHFDPSKYGTCAPTRSLMVSTYVQGAIIFACDAWLAILPSIFIWSLRLDRKIKIATAILLGLGGTYVNI
jgi:hypothetical protein